MPAGQSFLVTPLALNLARRVTFTACRWLGQSPREAAMVADEVAFTAASIVGTAAAVVTIDPGGAAMSASYLALEAKEAALRADDTKTS